MLYFNRTLKPLVESATFIYIYPCEYIDNIINTCNTSCISTYTPLVFKFIGTVLEFRPNTDNSVISECLGYIYAFLCRI